MKKTATNHAIPTQCHFIALLGGAIFWFSKNVGRIRRNILLGRDVDRSDNASGRRANMLRVAFGQSKMQARPIAGFLHFIIYASFLIINIEVLEIIIDGIFGTHRYFAHFLGGTYDVIISFFEILAVATIVTVVIFWWRRNVGKLDRFHKPEMEGWPFKDANIILYIEVALMFALLNMNAVEENFTSSEHSFIVSHSIAPLWSGLSDSGLHLMERFFWWIHIAGYSCLFELPTLLQAFPHHTCLSKYLLRESRSERKVCQQCHCDQRGQAHDGSYG